MDINFSDNAKRSIGIAKENTTVILEGEIARHDAALELAMAQYEAAIRIENHYHSLRVGELERIITMLNERI